MGKMATQTYAKSVGGKGSDGSKIVTSSELSTYGCKLKAGESYGSNQCVQEQDIESAIKINKVNCYIRNDVYLVNVTTDYPVTTELSITLKVSKYDSITGETYTEETWYKVPKGSSQGILQSQGSIDSGYRFQKVTIKPSKDPTYEYEYNYVSA